jgi:hypothetical protein
MHLLAYIDPGSGSLFIQAVIASALVVPFLLRSRIRSGVARFRGRRTVAGPAATTAPPGDIAPHPDDDASSART